ncbi:MAG: hypothetical protein JXR76_28635 [Deltaproteobacteria bacterium]|nr:hypothetical protein [Deltaproteobacteria bacterium]
MAQELTIDFTNSKEKLEALYDTLMAFDKGEVRQFNMSVPAVMPHALKMFKSFTHDRDIFAATFEPAAFNVAAYDDFATRLGALWHADILLNQATAPLASVAVLIEASKPLYRKLAKSAQYLWGDDESLGKVVASIREGQGHMDQADDLARYAVLFEENWADAEGKCDVTKADVTQAREYSVQILNAMADKTDSSISDLRDLRNRAGEYVRRAVDDIRDAALYVFRKDGDVNDRYPSLFTGRIERRRKAAKSKVDAAATVSEDPSTPVVLIENA